MDTILYETGRPTLRGDRAPNHVAYQHAREGLTELLSTLEPGADPAVPACPEWTVRDLLAHLVGAAALAVGRLSGWLPTGRPPSSGMGVHELLGEWDRLGAEAEKLVAARGGRCGSIMVMDVFVHELDLRHALGVPPPAEHPAFACAFEVLANGFSASVLAHDLPGVRLSVGSTQWTVGGGEPLATVSADRIDLCRSLAGRRSHQQIAALDWDRDSHRWLPAFTWGPFTPPVAAVEPSVRPGRAVALPEPRKLRAC